MKVAEFIDFLELYLNVDFFSGVPDSLLRPLIDGVIRKYGISDKHIIAVNEGNATALAAGYYLATGKIPCVYMQNSGQGNMVNPFASLLSPDVYKIPCVFIVGWRGEPGEKDEPQHIFQGKITRELMDLLKIENVIISENDTLESVIIKSAIFKKTLQTGKSVAFIIEKGALEYDNKEKYGNSYDIKREDAIKLLVDAAEDDIIVCTTGKASRELYEIREGNKQTHERDFLTVGSMGHCSSIALAIALFKKEKKVWCIDGDGALLMHMGALAVIGASSPPNYIHILINNEAHETVGGMPTAAEHVNFAQIAKGCGYRNIWQARNLQEVRQLAKLARESNELSFIEIRTAIGAREDLGRPVTTAEENKKMFMRYLEES